MYMCPSVFTGSLTHQLGSVRWPVAPPDCPGSAPSSCCLQSWQALSCSCLYPSSRCDCRSNPLQVHPMLSAHPLSRLSAHYLHQLGLYRQHKSTSHKHSNVTECHLRAGTTLFLHSLNNALANVHHIQAQDDRSYEIF